MTLLTTGSNEKFASGWENIFGGKKGAKKSSSPAAKAAGKKPLKPAKSKAKAAPKKKGAKK